MLPSRLETWLHAPLVNLSAGTVTLASLLTTVGLVLFALIFARLAARALRPILAARGVSDGVQFAAAKITRYLISFIGIAVAFESLGFNLSTVLAASAALLVGIGMGLQGLAQNVIAGVQLLVEQPVRKGDFVKVGDAYGVIGDIGLLATRVVTRDEVVVIVPNSHLTTSQVINHSVPTTNVRIAVQVGAAYGTDTALVRQTLTGVATRSDHVLKSPPPEVRFDDFGDSSLAFSLLVWIEDPRDDLRIASELRFAIDTAFREARIEIPFPQRVVRMGRREATLEKALPAEAARAFGD